MGLDRAALSTAEDLSETIDRRRAQPDVPDAPAVWNKERNINLSQKKKTQTLASSPAAESPVEQKRRV